MEVSSFELGREQFSKQIRTTAKRVKIIGKGNIGKEGRTCLILMLLYSWKKRQRRGRSLFAGVRIVRD